MTLVMIFYAPVAGLSSSLDTLCSQAFGSGNKHLVGLLLQRMIAILACLMVPIWILFWNAGKILALVVPDPMLAELSGRYLCMLMLGTPGVALYEAGKRFVQAQGIFRPVAYALMVAFPLNVFLNWFLVVHIGIGFDGAPLAISLSQLTLPLTLLFYVRFVDGSQCWGGFSRRAFTNWGDVIRLAFPGMVLLWAEWFAFEALALMSSQFGTDYIAAHSIANCVLNAMFQFINGLGTATCTRMGQWIGAGKVNAAQEAAKVVRFSRDVTLSGAGLGPCLLTLSSLSLSSITGLGWQLATRHFQRYHVVIFFERHSRLLYDRPRRCEPLSGCWALGCGAARRRLPHRHVTRHDPRSGPPKVGGHHRHHHVLGHWPAAGRLSGL